LIKPNQLNQTGLYSDKLVELAGVSLFKEYVMVGRRGMGIVGVAATAKVVSNRTQAQAEEKAAQQAQAQQAAAPAAAAAPAGDDLIAQLEKLASLKASGILSEEEFTAAKAKLISGS
jgi:membrane protease subunit (stomatin/prohibitin family)